MASDARPHFSNMTYMEREAAVRRGFTAWLSGKYPYARNVGEAAVMDIIENDIAGDLEDLLQRRIDHMSSDEEDDRR